MLLCSSGKTRRHVTKQAQYNYGDPTGHAKPNPILDPQKYFVEFQDDTEAQFKYNGMAQSMYTQCDHDSNQYLMLDFIVDFRRSITALCYADPNFLRMDAFISADIQLAGNMLII